MITFERVTKRYPDGTVAVDALDLDVPAGKTMVLVGPSGCGKTTSLRMINRLIEPTQGRILLDGKDIREQNPAHLRRGIGYVIQQTGLFPHRTVEDNIATVPVLNGWRRAKARGRARELLTLVGLDPALARRYPYQLSGGQQQRVGVARALAADPPVLLMDEPFSAVDPIVRASLQDQLITLQTELHKTVVLVTHDIEEAIKVGDLVALFRPHGKIAQLDTPERLLGAPVDDYVAGFVGFDRGIRRLSFFSTAGLSLNTEPVLGADATVAKAQATGEPWILVVNGGKPLGWVQPDKLGQYARRHAARPGAGERRSGTRSRSAPTRCARRSTRRCSRPPGRESAWTATARSWAWRRSTSSAPPCRRRRRRRTRTPRVPAERRHDLVLDFQQRRADLAADQGEPLYRRGFAADRAGHLAAAGDRGGALALVLPADADRRHRDLRDPGARAVHRAHPGPRADRHERDRRADCLLALRHRAERRRRAPRRPRRPSGRPRPRWGTGRCAAWSRSSCRSRSR